MEFINLENYQIEERNNYYRQVIVVDGDKLLDLPMSQAQEYLQKKMKMWYLNQTVLFDCIIQGDLTEEDFEIAVEFLVSSILKRNELEDMIDGEIRLGLPERITSRVNCALLPLKSAFDHKAENNVINIICRTENNNYKYNFIEEK